MRNDEISKAADEYAALIRKTNDDIAEMTVLFGSLLAKLPRTVMVAEDCISPGVIFRGTSELFPEAYWHNYSPETKRKRTIAFSFYPDNFAEIAEGWYDGGLIFQGSWTEALCTIVEMMSLTVIGVDDRTKAAMERFLKELK